MPGRRDVPSETAGIELQVEDLPHSGNIGALIIRLGFWGPLYYNYNKEPGNHKGPYAICF